MLKPVAASKTANTMKWNQSTPKYHRYSGTAVSVRKKVPIRKELVVQLMRSVEMRKITGRNLRVLADQLSAINYQLDVALPKITSPFAQVWILPQCAQVNFCALTLAVCQRFSSIVRPV